MFSVEKDVAGVAAADLSRGALKRLRVHGTIAREIGMAIVSGRVLPGELLDGEIEASGRRHVSRTAYREALRILAAKGLIHSRPRTGTRVARMQEWHLLDPDVLSWTFDHAPRTEVIHGVFELRKIVEPAAAAIAALRRSQDHLDQMRRALDDMAAYTLRHPKGREADKDFHAALLAATCNPFIISMANGVTAAVNSLTEFKLRLTGIERDAVPDHVRVCDAIADMDAAAARKAMEKLIRLAILDMPPEHWPRPWR
jgi:DNA-binding FadR family transcriptional regulator